MFVPLKFINTSLARDLAIIIAENGGLPSPDRVLILSPKDQDVRINGIIIPGTNKEDIPNQGVVIMSGVISEEYNPYRDMVETGRVVTYGMYAGKEINFNPEWFKNINISLSEYKFTILSLTEVLFSENNPKDIKYTK